MEDDDTDGGTNTHGDDVSTACLMADDGSLDPSDVDGNGGCGTQKTSGASVAYQTRSNRLYQEIESFEPQAVIPEDVASYIRTVRPLSLVLCP
jgi:hypothetical protein